MSTTTSAAAAASTTPANPLLQYQPNYSRSLVIQLIVLSAVAALHIVLLLHLLFTTKYHLPLARFNYLLLTGGCVVSFAALFWQIVEVASATRQRSLEWPFVFDYLQYGFPMKEWAMSKQVAWLVVNALVVFLCHAAHIHVLTLLYPSKLEKRLIIALLLPLCIVACALSFAPLLSSQREQDIFDSGAAVCNSTLTLLYTCALAFWGSYIARKRAWGQADESGSTAVFGGCALGMALLGTILSFISISRSADIIENGGWLDRVTWMVLLWQTWFTVWWWIGAGMYGAERPLDDDEEVETDKMSSRARLRSRRIMAENSIKRYFDEGLGGTLRLRHRTRSFKRTRTSGTDEGNGESIELAPMQRSGSGMQDSSSRPRSPVAAGTAAASLSEARATLDSSESSSNSTNHPPTFLNNLVRRIRKAHVRAAKAAHRDMMETAEQNPDMNDAIIGRRGKGWSVSGIMISRQDGVARRAAAGAGQGGRDAAAAREDRRVGAMRLDEEEEDDEERRIREDTTPWIDDEDEQQQRRADDVQRYPPAPQARRTQLPKPQPVTSKKFQNWRRKDVTRYE